MRQRIQIAKALTQGADALLLDEPLAGVDPGVRTRVVELLGRLRSGSTTAVVVATRDPDIARLLADRIVVLDNGEVIEAGVTDQVLENPRDARTRELVERRRSA
jgi:putative phosphonate transport system ATP-binding protein